MPRIKPINAFQTNDGTLHKTLEGAQLHINVINNNIRYYRTQIQYLVTQQRETRTKLKKHVEYQKQGINAHFYKKVAPLHQKEIEYRSKELHALQMQLNELITTLKNNKGIK